MYLLYLEYEDASFNWSGRPTNIKRNKLHRCTTVAEVIELVGGHGVKSYSCYKPTVELKVEGDKLCVVTERCFPEA